MKNLVSILVLVFAISFTTQAQRKKDSKKPQFSIEQHTHLKVKEMTLALDLSEKQQNQIMPLIKEQITQRKAMMQDRKAAKEENRKPSSEEVYAMKIKQLDHKILMKNEMKNILTKEQFEKFEKMHNKRKTRGEKKMKMKRAKKAQKENN